MSDVGNGDVTVNGGSVHLNGSIDVGSNGHLTTTPADMTITATGTCNAGCSPPAVYADPIADPLATSLTLPPTHNYTTVKNNPCTDGPGIYGSVSLPILAPARSQPGLYIIDRRLAARATTRCCRAPG